MGGKAVLLVVVGFGIIFLTMGLNLNRNATRSVTNATDFFEDNIAHNIAVSGANFAANQIFLDPTWTNGYSNVDYQGGEFDVSVDIVNSFRNIRRIISTGTFDGHTSTVKITLQPSNFSKFGYYSVTEPPGIWWTTGDTVWGPFHTQDYLRISGDPVFMGKTTTKYGIQYNGSSKNSNPEFNGGYEQGVDLPMPPSGVTDIAAAAASGGIKITGQSVVYLTFSGNNITYQYGNNGQPTTVPASQFAPNGVIYVEGGDVRLKGVITGQYTIATSSIDTTITMGGGRRGGGRTQTITQGGNVYLDGDVTYSTNPLTNPNSTDMLGIVAENNVYITDNTQNSNNINIDAAIYCQNGSFTAENYNKRPVSGTINLLGGITQNVRGPVGTFSINHSGGINIRSGFNKSYRYDERLMFSSPPAYPNTGSFELDSWCE